MELLIRYTSRGDADEKAHAYLKALTGNVMIVEEYGQEGAKHYHAWYKGIMCCRNVAAWLSRNGFTHAYSCKQGTGNPLYMCKGPEAVSKLKSPQYPGVKKPPVVIVNTFEGVDVQASHDAWWKEAQAWKDKKTAAKASRDEYEKQSLRALMYAWYSENEDDLMAMYGNVRLRAMLAKAWEFAHATGKWGQYDVCRVVECLYAGSDDGKEELIDECFKRIKRQ